MSDIITLEPTQEFKHVFDILLREETKRVGRIEGLEHEFGKVNNYDPTLWLELNPGEMVAYDPCLKRIVWDIEFKQRNSGRDKWTGYRSDCLVSCRIKVNLKTVYSFSSRSYGYALGKAQTLMVELSEHVFNWFDPKSENGRKIFYHGQPAVLRVEQYDDEGVVIFIRPATDDPEWWDRLVARELETETNPDDCKFREEGLREWQHSNEIKYGSPLNAEYIEWFRD